MPADAAALIDLGRRRRAGLISAAEFAAGKAGVISVAAAAAPVAGTLAPGAAAQLVALRRRQKAGALTPAEFATEKARIFSGAVPPSATQPGGGGSGAPAHRRPEQLPARHPPRPHAGAAPARGVADDPPHPRPQQTAPRGYSVTAKLADAELLRRLSLISPAQYTQVSRRAVGADNADRYGSAEQAADLQLLQQHRVIASHDAAEVARRIAASDLPAAQPAGAAEPGSPGSPGAAHRARQRIARKNTCTEGNTPEIVELSPAGSPAGSPTGKARLQLRNSCVESNTPDECVLSPPRARPPPTSPVAAVGAPAVYDGEAPITLAVTCPNKAQKCTATYNIATAADGSPRIVNGCPVWRAAGAQELWLFSTPAGFWRITDSEGDFVSGRGYVISKERHQGRSPSDMEMWQTFGKKDDPDIVVSASGEGCAFFPPAAAAGDGGAAAAAPGSPWNHKKMALAAARMARPNTATQSNTTALSQLSPYASPEPSPTTKRLRRPNTATETNTAEEAALSPPRASPERRAAPASPPRAPASPPQVAGPLMELQRRRDAGEISAEEYTRAKRASLGLPCVKSDARVEARGLESAEHLNGQRGTVVAMSENKPDRWIVMFDDGAIGKKLVGLKNLFPVA